MIPNPLGLLTNTYVQIFNLSGFLVRSGCYNNIPQSGWLINNKYLFLTVLEAGKSKIKVPEWSLFGEGPLSGLSGNYLQCPHMADTLRISRETLS